MVKQKEWVCISLRDITCFKPLSFNFCLAPVAPDKHSLLSVNSTAISIYLDSFHNGGCSITKFEIMYKMQRMKKWINLPMTENDVDFRRVFITSLKPSTNYDLIISATNEASTTQAQYAFSTFALIKGNEEQREFKF